MKPNSFSFTKEEAVYFSNRNRRPGQIYMKKFDVDLVFRRGKQNDDQIDKVRYKEDHRPQKFFDKHLGAEVDKRNDIITFKMAGKDEVYVLAKSGGASLFDGVSSKVRLGPKDCWWVITQNAKLEEGLIIAKDAIKDKEGNTHYSIEAERDMPISEYLEKLACLKKYMKRL